MIPFKAYIKVPLVLGENLLFFLFPRLRPLVEKYLYNPLDFKQDHILYTQKKFQEFLNYTEADLQGKTLLELGPGGSLGFGLLALEQGLDKYIAIDDGLHTFISNEQLLGYKKLIGKGDATLTKYFSKTHQGWQYRPEKIQSAVINQTSIYPLPDASVDIIYSCAVLEHVHDLALCYSEMSRVLRPGGIMYHEVDLRDHIFSQQSLWFLTIPQKWFHALFSRTGAYVNRLRISDHKKLAARYHFRISKIAVPQKFTSPSFPKKLASLTPEDRETLTFIAVMEKHE